MAMDCLLPQLLAEANGFDSTTWIVLVIGCAATMYIMYRARRQAKRDPLQKHPVTSSMAQHRAVERQMSTLLIELSEMARTVNATIETRTAKLEALIDAADQRIETLRTMNGSSSASATPSGGPSVVTSSNRAEPEIIAATVAPSRVTPSRVLSSTATTMSGASDDRHTQIYGLADRGRSVQEIAAALGRPSGEIELILALRSREAVG